MASDDFGVYILTYPGDFHLSTVLVRSLQHVSPDIPIMIIPGEGFDRDDHPFDVPLLPLPAGFWAEIGHQDRCFWAFQGPFDTFVYLDADMICTKSLESLRRRITQQQGNFIYVHTSIGDQDWLTLINDPDSSDNQKYARQVKREIGRDPLMQFDPSYDLFANCPFNSGVFASRRFAITRVRSGIIKRSGERFLSRVSQEGMELAIERAVFSRSGPPQLSGQQIGDSNLSSATRSGMSGWRRCNSGVF